MARIGTWAKWFPMIGYHHVCMGILLFPMVMLSVLLAGCSSNGMSGVYLMSLQYNPQDYTATKGPGQVNTLISQAVHNVSKTGDGTTFEVRAGYMGLCVGQNSDDRICSSSASALANLIGVDRKTIIIDNSSVESSPDPLNLIMIAEEFRRKIVFDGLIYITIAVLFMSFIAMSTFPGWHEDSDEYGSEREIKPFPARSVSHFALTTSLLGSVFGMISVLWQHIASSSTTTMAEVLTYGAVKGHVGDTAMIFGWASVGGASIVSLALVIMILSIRLLRRLTDEEDGEDDDDSS